LIVLLCGVEQLNSGIGLDFGLGRDQLNHGAYDLIRNVIPGLKFVRKGLCF
jgi:hypothetical protein